MSRIGTRVMETLDALPQGFDMRPQLPQLLMFYDGLAEAAVSQSSRSYRFVAAVHQPAEGFRHLSTRANDSEPVAMHELERGIIRSELIEEPP